MALAQQPSLKGKISDTLEKKNLANAVVTLLKKSDSTLFKFTRSGKDGSFYLGDLTPGKYILLVTYPKFADYADDIEITSQPVQDAGKIPLTLRSSLLDAVVIRSAGAIRIKGDTTEFVADSFHVKEGATVEDLLKKLPGFQVNSKGEVTAQGQRVGKVLVDGEEFFGDDPTMATQNISAKAVDKVQVFDTKSDQQNLTGISTGTEGKTVNIKLKEDAKKGMFGKAHIASDFDKLVDSKLLFNRFSGKKKISVFGTKSKVSTGSLNWDERQKLGIEENYEYDELAGFYYSFSSGDEFNNWSLRGLPDSYSAGALYSDKWKDDRNSLNASYRFNRLGTVNTSSTLTQNLLNNITYRNKFQASNGLNQQHAANLKYEWKLDSFASFKFTAAGVYKTNELFSTVSSEFLDANREFINKSLQVTDNHITKKQLDNQLAYKQLFKKANRQLLVTLRYGITDDAQNGIVTTNTSFYKNNAVDSTDVADQQKIMSGLSKTFGTKMTWSEPLSLTWNLVVDYGYNRNNSGSHRNTYNKDLNGKYAVLDEAFSNNFELDAFSHSASAIFRYTGKKMRAAFGTGMSRIKLNLLDIDSSHTNIYRFLNYTPQASFSYMPKPQTRIYLNYRGTTRQPTIDQMQPIRDNADRLNIFVGNPNLKVGFNHSIGGGYSSFKTLSQTYLMLNVNYNIPVNAIAFYNSVDVTRGKQTYTPVNVNGNRNWYMYGNLFKEGGDGKLGYGFDINANGGRNKNFVNEIENNVSYQRSNTTRYFNTELSINLRINKEEKYSLELGPTAGYNRSTSSLNPQQNIHYWQYGGDVEGSIQLPARIEIRSDCEFDFRQQISDFAKTPNQIRWNAQISKAVFKDKSGKFYFIANDILDQNRGFDRNINTNFISENRYSKISRYFLLKFEWTFNKMPGGTK